MSDRKRHGLVLLLVLGLLAASAVVIAAEADLLGLDLKGGVQLTYKATPTPQTPVVTSERAGRHDLDHGLPGQPLGVSQAADRRPREATRSSRAFPTCTTSRAPRTRSASTAQLEFYDWEANALTAERQDGRQPVAAAEPEGAADQPGRRRRARAARARAAWRCTTRSSSPPSSRRRRRTRQPVAAGQPVLPVRRARDRRRARPRPRTRNGPGPGRALLPRRASPATADSQQLKSPTLPKGVSFSDGQVLTVPQGWVVLQASNPTAADTIKADEPAGAVLRAQGPRRAERHADLQPDRPSTRAASRRPVRLQERRRDAFQNVTATIAHRGQQRQHRPDAPLPALRGGAGRAAAERPADRLHQVPGRDRQHRRLDRRRLDQGTFTTKSAQDLATQLRLGTLPVKLSLISETDVSASLGARRCTRR